jgi:SAM-dependent methyltransferase
MSSAAVRSKILGESEFYRYVLNEYKPSQYELFPPEDTRFSGDVHYPHVCRTRCYLVYREIARQLPAGGKILDFGFYPGTLLRQLKELLGDKVQCYGSGLKVDEEFEKYVEPFVEQCVYMELDRFYAKPGQEIRASLEDESMDAAILTEVMEHLISPLDMLAETARVLKKGGLFLMTTPNVSHFGSVLKLMVGRSNYERLDRSPMYLVEDEWRGHIRFYDKRELQILGERHGLKMVLHQYYNEKGWSSANKSAAQQLAYWFKELAALIPIYRQGHFAVFRKE